ncbi:hypothetical protein [Terriglobus albidus]|uniref:hypothetical protein n=1 Tax=Terriglobus albidus TaxID=1592106 RepID=UPI0021E06861|nr:hypothetical protein [Terriglobus albidus]
MLVSVLSAVILIGCRDTSVGSLPHDQAVAAQLCQATQHLTIGFPSDGHLVVLNPCNTDINHSIHFETAPNAASVYDYSATESPDRKWVAKQENKQLVLQHAPPSGPGVNIQTTRLLTAPQWSPDSAFFFFWAAEDRKRGRSLAECLDDVSDLYVFSTKSRTGTLVGRVCSGVPLEAFRWLSL